MLRKINCLENDNTLRIRIMIFVDLQKRIQIQLTFSQSHPVQ